jgi:Mg-chelatase subunit ChlD
MAERDWTPSRIAGAQAAAVAFCQRLARDLPGARIAIVAYGEVARLLCPLTPASMLQPLMEAIGRISFISATNIASGLEMALEVLAPTGRPGQVVLLSDGHNNTGPNPRPVAEALRRFALVETVGIGGSPSAVDEPLLKEIASYYPNGKKRYRWIGDKNDLIQHFDALAGGISRS